MSQPGAKRKPPTPTLDADKRQSDSPAKDSKKMSGAAVLIEKDRAIDKMKEKDRERRAESKEKPSESENKTEEKPTNQATDKGKEQAHKDDAAERDSKRKDGIKVQNRHGKVDQHETKVEKIATKQNGSSGGTGHQSLSNGASLPSANTSQTVADTRVDSNVDSNGMDVAGNGTGADQSEPTGDNNGTFEQSNGTDAASNGKDAASNGRDAARNKTDAASSGKDAASNKTDAASNKTDATNNGADVASNGSDVASNGTNDTNGGVTVTSSNDEEMLSEREVRAGRSDVAASPAAAAADGSLRELRSIRGRGSYRRGAGAAGGLPDPAPGLAGHKRRALLDGHVAKRPRPLHMSEAKSVGYSLADVSGPAPVRTGAGAGRTGDKPRCCIQ